MNADRSVLREKVDNTALSLGIEDSKASGGWLHQFKAQREVSYRTASAQVKNTSSFFFFIFTFPENFLPDFEKKVQHKFTSYSTVAQ